MPQRLGALARPTLGVLAALLLWGTAAGGQDATPARWTTAERVVVLPDVHGAYDELVALLKATGLIGQDLKWAGGRTVAVSLGDLLDRGPGSRRVMDLLMRLQDEARASGGRLHVILGNHETMNLMGDLRYLAPEDYAAFAADETPAQREEAFAVFAAAAAAAAGPAPDPGAAGLAVPAPAPDPALLLAAFDQAYPQGFFARQAALESDGRYGRWLMSLPAVVVVNDTAYVHGGPSGLVAEAGTGLNDTVRAKLARFFELRNALVAAAVLPRWDMRRDRDIAKAALESADPALQGLLAEYVALEESPEFASPGPFWYRGSVYCKPMLEDAVLSSALARFGVKRFVVGHTPTGDRRVRGLHGGRLVMLDAGMLRSRYDGRPAALVTEAGETRVQYALPDERASIDMSGNAQDYGLTEAGLRKALEEGPVTVTGKGVEGAAWTATVRDGEQDLAAYFYPDGGNELAAAALDDLLGSSLVAPTVARELEGVKGALQLRYPGAISEAERLQRGLGFGAWCPMPPQVALMNTFDLLIAHRSRDAGNILFTQDRANLVLTGHREAFGADRSLPDGLDKSKLAVPSPMVEALRRLDERALESALGEWVGRRERSALLSRRDELLGD